MQSHYVMDDPTRIANLFFSNFDAIYNRFYIDARQSFPEAFLTLGDDCADCEDCRETNLNDVTKCVCICKVAVYIYLSVKYLQTNAQSNQNHQT